MIKVLFLIESLGGGGAEKVLTDIVRSLDKSRYDITVTTITDNGVYDDEIREICKYKSVLKSSFNNGSILQRLLYKIKYKLIYMLPSKLVYKMIVKEKYDIEIAFVEGYATKIIGNSLNKKSKKISWVHVDPIERDYSDKYFRSIDEHSRCYGKFEKIICVSESVKTSLLNKYRINKNKVVTIYNPIDKNTIIKKSYEHIDDMLKSNFILVTVGRLVEQKGYDRLLKCINKLKNIDKLELELIILGEGELRGKLQDYIDRNNLSNNVKLLGFKKNPYKYIANSNLFVCSSRAEGFSLVIAEAMTLGIPVISTNCSGPNELLGFGTYGVLVDNNEEGLYEGLKKIVNNKYEIDKLVYASKKGASMFEYEKCIDKIEQLLQN